MDSIFLRIYGEGNHMERITDLMHILFNSTNMPMCLVKDKKAILSLPVTASGVYTESYLDICILDYNVRCQNKEEKYYALLINPGYMISVFMISDDMYLVLGPGILHKLSLNEIMPWSESLLYTDNKDAMEQFFLQLEATTILKFMNTLSTAVYFFNNRIVKAEEILLLDPIRYAGAAQSNLTKYVFEAKEYDRFHTSHSLESQITDAVKTGNVELLKNSLNSSYIGKLGVLSLNKERQIRYMFVTVVAVMMRAAVRGGVNYETACSLADNYCQRMDKIEDLYLIESLQTEVMFGFCNEVAKTMNENKTAIIKACCDYINKNTHNKILLEDLSEIVHLSPRRLSEKFKNEMGVSIVDYIHKTKIEEAASLLRYTDYSICDVCNFLNYSSQSYFIKIFKKYTGMTPIEYKACRETLH